MDGVKNDIIRTDESSFINFSPIKALTILAKLIKQNGIDIGQNRLFEWLRVNKYLISRKGSDYNLPTQRSMQQGLFEIKESSHVNGDGVNIVTKTPKVTGKGQQYFINRFLAQKDSEETAAE